MLFGDAKTSLTGLIGRDEERLSAATRESI